MSFYRVFLRGGIIATVEVSLTGMIVGADPMLRNSIGLRFARFSAWVKRKGGEIYLVTERP
jgi:hypothetical protein